jgi:ORF6N domain
MISLGEFDPAMPSTHKIVNVEGAIYLIRGQRVMLDSDLAAIYGTSTMRLNEQFKRNRKRFPDDFAFVLTREELTNLISQNAISRSHGGSAHLAGRFEMVAANTQLATKLEELERRFDSHDEAIADLFAALKRLIELPEQPKRREIGFHVCERSRRYRTKKRF